MANESLQKIKQLIQQKKYEDANNMIDEALETTFELTKFIDVKALVLLEQGEAEKAFKLYCNYTVFIDGIPFYSEMLNNFSRAALMVNKKMLSNTLGNVYRAIASNTDTLKDNRIISELENELTDNILNAEVLYKLACAYAEQWKTMEAVIYMTLAKKVDANLNCDELYELLTEYQQASLMVELLETGNHSFFVISSSDDLKYKLLSYALSILGDNVYLILPPLTVETESTAFNMDELLKITFDNIDFDETVHSVVPVQLVCNNKVIADTLENVLNNLTKSLCTSDSFILLSEKDVTKKLYDNIGLRKSLEIIFQYYAPYKGVQLSASFIGNYLYTAKYLYGFDVPANMESEPEVKISVVLPVRGGLDTFRHTLRTCIEQDFENYEIVVSDNNDADDNRISDYINQLNNPKIKYYKTPRVLPMHKNFEYGYLRTKGEFIFSLGADDGLLSYALKYISSVVDSKTRHDVFTWKRLLYMWPNFKGNERDRFQMYLASPHNLNYEIIKSEETYEKLIENWEEIYLTPTAYINSGMRRRNILKMINITGKVIEGESPDMYVGVLNTMINDEIIHINFNMAIAGMSSSSNGTNSNAEKRQGIVWENIKLKNSFTASCLLNRNPPSFFEKKSMPLSIYTNFSCEILRLSIYGIVSSELLDKINHIDIYEKFINRISPNSTETELLISLVKLNAGNYGIIFLKIVEDALLKKYKKGKDIVKIKSNDEKTYGKGWLAEENLIVIDGSEFNITNIYEAREFYQKLINI